MTDSQTSSSNTTVSSRYTVTGYTSDISQIVSNVCSSLVTVDGAKRGTGVIFGSEDGIVYVVTSSDLVSNLAQVDVTFDSGVTLTGDVIGKDEGTKVAVLSIATDFEVTVFSRGNSDALVAGAYVIGVGARNPDDGLIHVSYGVSSSVGMESLSNHSVYISQVFESDCMFDSDDVGAVMMDAGGALIGMVIDTDSNKAIAIADMEHAYEQIVETGSVTRGSMSITCTNVSDLRSYQKNERGMTLDMTSGVIVNSVSGNATDLIQKDDVIVSIEGEAVESISNLRDMYYTFSSGQQVSITVVRSGENVTVSVILE